MRTDQCRALVLALGLSFAPLALRLNVAAQSAPAGQSSDSRPAAAKRAGDTFKNLQVLGGLKGAPSSQLFDTMQVIAGSLSVSCDYCHVAESGPFDVDAKKTKLIARDMIRLTRTINQNNFGGRLVVTCNTCHQGSPHPKATPSPWNRTIEQIDAYRKSGLPAATDPAVGPHQPPEPAVTLPDVSEVMANYRRAVGTTALRSLHLSGVAADVNRGSRPREVYAVFPDKIVVSSGSVQQIVNGDRGWQLTPQARTDLPVGTIAAIKSFAALLQPVKYPTSDSARMVTGIERIGNRSYYLVESHPGKVRPTGPPNSYPDAVERQFFDVQTGLLYKLQVTIGTPLGARVEETSFEDYRDVGGLKLPYAIIQHYTEDENLMEIAEMQANIDIDPAKFEPVDPKGQKGGGR